MSKKISLGVAATIAIIAMAVTFSLTMVVSMKMFNTTVSSVKNKERQYNKLSEIDRFVRSEEFFTIDEDTLNDRLAAGYMNGINDKYAVYYTAKEYSEKQAVEKGTLTGIGVAVVNDASSGYARIIRLYDNSPAAEAGMQVGGFITAINDESTRNITSSARLTSKLLGEEGTTTAVTYLTPDRQEQQFNLVHSNYKTPRFTPPRWSRIPAAISASIPSPPAQPVSLNPLWTICCSRVRLRLSLTCVTTPART